MEVALRCSTLSKVGHGNSVFTIYAIIIAGARGLRHLSTEGRRDSDDIHVTRAIMNRHLLAASKVILVSGKLVPHLLDREASPEEGTSFAILRENKVIIVKSGSGADAGRLLSQLSHVEGDPCLALGSVVNLVCLIYGHHLVIHLEEEVV